MQGDVFYFYTCCLRVYCVVEALMTILNEISMREYLWKENVSEYKINKLRDFEMENKIMQLANIIFKN